jgi:SPP1 family holin
MTTGTIVRVVALVLSLVNQVLVAFDMSPINVGSAELEMYISTGITVLLALVAMWKNNSFTAGAQAADRVKEAIADGVLTPEEIDELIAATKNQK